MDRELIGMFGVRYALHTTIVPSLQSLLGHRIAPVLVTRDFNINPKRMRFSDRLNKDSLTYPDLQRRVTLSGPNQAHGQTIVLVTHDPNMAAYADRIVTLIDGLIVSDERVEHPGPDPEQLGVDGDWLDASAEQPATATASEPTDAAPRDAVIKE